MAEKVVMVALSPTMEDGTIAGWSKKEGESVSAGDVLCEVETDKATMDYESTQEGTLLKIVKGDGESATVGEMIGVLGEEGEDISDLLAEAESGGADSEESGAKESGAKEEEADVSKGGDGSSGGKTGSGGEAAAAKQGEPAKPSGGDPSAAASGPDAPTGSTAASSGPAAAAGSGAARGQSGIVKASPLARKIASDKGIDIAQVPGSGPAGRVVKADVENFKGAPAAAVAEGGAASAPAMMPGQDRTIRVDRMRATFAKRLGEIKFGAPHLYLKLSVDMRGILEARSRLNKELGDKVSLNAFMMKFAAETLKRHPNVNSSWQGENIIEYGSVDIGLAVEMKAGGLITPVVRNCANRGIIDIDAELKGLIEKARGGSLKPEEFSGATFSISNLGNFGIEEFTAIINPPGSAILALGNTQKTPVFDDNDNMSVVPKMKMTLSCDHRVVDGAAGARFLHDLQRLMEDPARALF